MKTVYILQEKGIKEPCEEPRESDRRCVDRGERLQKDRFTVIDKVLAGILGVLLCLLYRWLWVGVTVEGWLRWKRKRVEVRTWRLGSEKKVGSTGLMRFPLAMDASEPWSAAASIPKPSTSTVVFIFILIFTDCHSDCTINACLYALLFCFRGHALDRNTRGLH